MQKDPTQMFLLSGLVPEPQDSETAKKPGTGRDTTKKSAQPRARAADHGGPGTGKSAAAKGRKADKASSARAEARVADTASLEDLSLDRFLCFALYSATHAMQKIYKPLLADIGLTYPQYLTLTVLWEKDKVPVGTLTERLQLETSTLTPLLKRLEAMGMVERKRSEKDERQVRVSLTRKGRALKAKTAHFASCVLAETGLSKTEAADLQMRVSALRDTLRSGGDEA
ncbi:hypothetical protein GCM10011316_33180 [Roseibium aquae]|uniref:HTH marR-type domain-containing protein n=1 Tax=Roseibium aquae TaxID=1323746 RepID=A0A916TMM5_9HYPH|nr:MarR family transcriptional regulator [Roseibium aquae]GGB58465.1 hypothetical protein GCM10011316_33180 [Roseibium aquae]